MNGNIFNKYLLSQYIEKYRKDLIAEIDRIEVIESTNVNQLVERLKRRYTIEPLKLGEPEPSDPIETYRDWKDDFGRPYKQKVYEIKVLIRFDGNHELFDCSPSTCTIIHLDKSVGIGNQAVNAKVTLTDLDPNKYDSAVGKIISDLNSNIPRVNQEIAPWNAGLEDYIKLLLQQRKGLVAKKHNFMEKIGLKVNPSSNDFITPNPVTSRKIPKPVSETTKEVKKDQIPVLQEEVYSDIKEVLYNVGQAIERKPSIYFEKDEEALRDVLLLFLETRYEATSGVGEAFNRKGKTDILLKYAKDSSNIFVAECKVWHGAKKLNDDIDQLLGYLTHRDSKTALIYFVRNKEFSAVTDKLKAEIQNHKQHKRHIRNTYNSSISYEFTLPDDTKKIIQMEVILFHFPEIS